MTLLVTIQLFQQMVGVKGGYNDFSIALPAHASASCPWEYYTKYAKPFGLFLRAPRMLCCGRYNVMAAGKKNGTLKDGLFNDHEILWKLEVQNTLG